MFACDDVSGCSDIPSGLCDDGDRCTIDGCEVREDGTAGCANIQKECPPHTTCFDGVCAGLHSEQHPPPGAAECSDCCEDGDLCTLDYLMSADGSCIHEPVWCDDGNACTVDACVEGACVHIPIPGREDDDPCTVEDCDPLTGAMRVIRRVVCGDDVDGDACTSLVCGPDATCVERTMDCGDKSRGPCATSKCVGGRCVDFGIPLCEMDLISSGSVPPCGSVGCDSRAGGCVVTREGCDDGNPCTDDSCSPDGSECVHRKKNCSSAMRESLGRPLNKCEVASCSAKSGGCRVTRVDCDDGNPCTFDACVDSTGKCSHAQIDCGCRGTDACIDCGCSRDAGGCWTSPRSCDDRDPTTIDWCEPKHGCRNRRVRCPGGSSALPPACREYDAACGSVPVDCDDSDPCTVDGCISVGGNGTCVHHPRCPWKVADDDGCYVPGSNCDPARGGVCKRPDRMTCDDGDACTVDACRRGGICEHIPVECPDSGDGCTLSACSPETGECATIVRDCDDSDPDTADSCEPGVGCVHSPVPATRAFRICEDVDGDPCTSERRRDGVCVSEPLCGPPRTSATACSYVRCERIGPRSAMCVRTAVECGDGDACTIDSCVEGIGCIHVAIDCDDRDPCTADFCRSGACIHAPVSCGDDDYRTVDSCEAGACVHRTCSDGLACTVDSRGPTGACVHVPRVCPAGDACEIPRCVELGYDAWECVVSRVECPVPTIAQGFPCAESACHDGNCVVAPVDCDDGNACTVDWCVSRGSESDCAHSDIDCDDGDACTVDSCNATHGCRHVAVQCDGRTCDRITGECIPADCGSAAADACEWCSYSEDAHRCVCERETCDDGDECTVDSCSASTGLCSHVSPRCPDRNCMVSVGCHDGACRYEELRCEGRGMVCNATSGACESVDTRAAVGPCFPLRADPCDRFERFVQGGDCILIGRKDCSDSDPCTVDSCDSITGECAHVGCDDMDACTVDTCDPAIGCVHASVPCDDGNACTIDACVAGECIHIESAHGRARSECDPADGAIVIPGPGCGDCDDGDACTMDACVEGVCDHRAAQCASGAPCTHGACVGGLGCIYVDVECGESGWCDPMTWECRRRDNSTHSEDHQHHGGASGTVVHYLWLCLAVIFLI
jgi:hypothetical protein